MNDDDYPEHYVVPEVVSVFYRLGACQGAKSICDGVIECIESGTKKGFEPEIMLDDIAEALHTRRRLYRKGIRELKEYLDDDD